MITLPHGQLSLAIGHSPGRRSRWSALAGVRPAGDRAARRSGPTGRLALVLAAWPSRWPAPGSLWRLRKRTATSRPTCKTVAAERRRAVKALRQTEVFYHSLVETIPQMILCKDLDGRFTFANQKFCAELGTHPRGDQGEDRFRLLPPRARREVSPRRSSRSSRAARSSTSSSEHVTPKGEKLYVQVMKTPLCSAPTASRSASRASSGT